MQHHHRLCDWNIVRGTTNCTCGSLQPKAPWFDAYVRGIEQQAAHLRRVCMSLDAPHGMLIDGSGPPTGNSEQIAVLPCPA